MTNTLTSHEVEEGELPEGWELRPLSDLGEVRLGRQRSPKNHSGPQMRPYLRAANVSWTGLSLDDVAEMNFSDEEMEVYLLEPGDILVNEASGSPSEVGKAAVFRGEIEGCAFQNTLIRVRADATGVEFLHQFLGFLAISGAYVRESRGVGIFHLGKTKLSAWPVPVPPREEQERIVEILEDQLSRLDTALQSVHTVREKAAQFRRSLLHAAFTGALTGHEVEEGELPEGWEIRDLRDVATLSLGKMLDRKQQTGLHPTPYLRNINVRWGNVDLDDVQTMDITPDQIDRVSLGNGDVVVCEGGEPGRAAVWAENETFAIQKALHRVRPVPELNPAYLYFVLEKEFRGVGDHPLFTGTTIKHLPKEKISLVRVPMPSLPEQERIVEILEDQLSRLDASLAVADAVEERSAALRRSLLHSAFTGRLTREWREAVSV